MDVSLEDNDSDGRERFLAPAWLLALWLLCGGLLFVGLGTAPIERTQEVRVLETAREMLGAGAQGWLIPKFNGVERLHKPPLNYWLTAICYKIFGVSAGVGRTPTALAAWATLGIVYACGRWLFGGRAGFFAAAALFGSFMFFKFMRLAETDALATVFVTLAIWAWWRAAEGRSRVGVPAHHGETPDEPAQDEPTVGGNAHPTMAQGHGAATVLEYRSARVPVADTAVRAAGTTHPWLWYHLGAVGVAGAVMSKGPPGIFPILFLLGYVVAARRKGALLQWLASGCWITALLLAAPWFWYVNHTVGLARIADEVEVVTTGRGHSNWFYIYFAYLVLDTAPWVAFVVVGLVQAVRPSGFFGETAWGRKWYRADRPVPRDMRLRGLIVWVLAILGPLCLIGNKQTHYLVPLMPPLMLLAGWIIGEALRADASPKLVATMRVLLLATLGGCVLAATAVPLTAYKKLSEPGHSSLAVIRPGDWALAGGMVAMALLAWVIYLRRGLQGGLLALAGASALLLVLMLGVWAPTLERGSWNAVAAKVNAAGEDGAGAGGVAGKFPCVFYGRNTNTRLCFALKRVVPTKRTPAELAAALADNPRTIVIVQEKPDESEARKARELALPDNLHLQQRDVEYVDDDAVRIYHQAGGE